MTLLEFDFKDIIEKGNLDYHVLADHFSHLTNGEAPIVIDDKTLNVALFSFDVISNFGIWIHLCLDWKGCSCFSSYGLLVKRWHKHY